MSNQYNFVASSKLRGSVEFDLRENRGYARRRRPAVLPLAVQRHGAQDLLRAGQPLRRHQSRRAQPPPTAATSTTTTPTTASRPTTATASPTSTTSSSATAFPPSPTSTSGAIHGSRATSSPANTSRRISRPTSRRSSSTTPTTPSRCWSRRGPMRSSRPPCACRALRPDQAAEHLQPAHPVHQPEQHGLLRAALRRHQQLPQPGRLHLQLRGPPADGVQLLPSQRAVRLQHLAERRALQRLPLRHLPRVLLYAPILRLPQPDAAHRRPPHLLLRHQQPTSTTRAMSAARR